MVREPGRTPSSRQAIKAAYPFRDAMERLLDVTGLPREDLFRSRDELIAQALVRQEERVAYVDEKLAAEASGEVR